jgi:hypothetical protein
MALTDFTTDDNEIFLWYSSDYDGIEDYTSLGTFGAGKDSTKEFVRIWDSQEIGSDTFPIVWKAIATEVGDGWFVPSAYELEAFIDALPIFGLPSDGDYYNAYNLRDGYYFSSYGRVKGYFIYAYFSSSASATCSGGCYPSRVRLSATF